MAKEKIDIEEREEEKVFHQIQRGRWKIEKLLEIGFETERMKAPGSRIDIQTGIKIQTGIDILRGMKEEMDQEDRDILLPRIDTGAGVESGQEVLVEITLPNANLPLL